MNGVYYNHNLRDDLYFRYMNGKEGIPSFSTVDRFG